MAPLGSAQWRHWEARDGAIGCSSCCAGPVSLTSEARALRFNELEWELLVMVRVPGEDRPGPIELLDQEHLRESMGQGQA
jgi:hypothetical protein